MALYSDTIAGEDTTTDGSTIVLASFSTSGFDDKSFWAIASVTGYNATDNEAFGVTMVALYKRDGSTLVKVNGVGTLPDAGAIVSAGAAPSATIADDGGNNIQLQCTGESSTTWLWVGKMEVLTSNS